MKKKEKNVKEEIKCNCKNGEECTCGKHCKCSDGCKCGDACKCGGSDKKYFLKLFFISFFGMLLFLGGLTTGAILLYNNDEVLEEKFEDNKSENKQDKDTNEKDEVEEWVYVSDYEKIEMRIKDLGRIEQVSRNINSVEDFTNQELLLFAIDRLSYDEGYSLKDVNGVTQTYFGIDIKPEDVNCPFSTDEAPLYLYDEKKKGFVPNEEHGAHGFGSYYSDILNRIIDVDVKDNIYTVKVKKAFGHTQDTGPATTTFYKTYKDMDELKNPIMDYKWETYEDVENYMPEVDFNNLDSNKMLTYTYVFEKIDEEFILVSYTF